MTVNAAGPDRRPLAVRWAWLLVLLGGVAAYLIVLRTLVATQKPALRAVPAAARLRRGPGRGPGLRGVRTGPRPGERRGDRGRRGDRWVIGVGIVSVADLLFVTHRSRTAGQRLQDPPTWTCGPYVPPTGPAVPDTAPPSS